MIAYVTSGDLGTSGSVSSVSVSADTTSTGSNRVLVVGGFFDSSTIGTLTVTYNSVALTQIINSVAGSGGTTILFYLLAPATGSNTLALSWDGGATVLSKLTFAVYQGVKQSSQPDGSAVVNQTGSATQIENTITSTANGSWHVMFIHHEADLALTAGTGTTERVAEQWFDNNTDISPSASDTIYATHTSNASQSHSA